MDVLVFEYYVSTVYLFEVHLVQNKFRKFDFIPVLGTNGCLYTDRVVNVLYFAINGLGSDRTRYRFK
jgi:hypothetical protein